MILMLVSICENQFSNMADLESVAKVGPRLGGIELD